MLKIYKKTIFFLLPTIATFFLFGCHIADRNENIRLTGVLCSVKQNALFVSVDNSTNTNKQFSIDCYKIDDNDNGRPLAPSLKESVTITPNTLKVVELDGTPDFTLQINDHITCSASNDTGSVEIGLVSTVCTGIN